MRIQSFVFGVCLIFVIAIFDVILKGWAISSLPLANTARFASPIGFALHQNPGIAFDIPIPFFIIFPLTIIIGIIFSYLAKAAFQHERHASLAAVAVVIGALGNLIDRGVHGFTTDYIILFHTSAINLSDLLIVLGMISFLWYHKGNPSVRAQEEM